MSMFANNALLGGGVTSASPVGMGFHVHVIFTVLLLVMGVWFTGSIISLDLSEVILCMILSPSFIRN